MTPVVERTQPYHQDLAVTGMVRVCYYNFVEESLFWKLFSKSLSSLFAETVSNARVRKAYHYVLQILTIRSR